METCPVGGCVSTEPRLADAAASESVGSVAPCRGGLPDFDAMFLLLNREDGDDGRAGDRDGVSA